MTEIDTVTGSISDSLAELLPAYGSVSEPATEPVSESSSESNDITDFYLRFFDYYHIPYTIYKRGSRKGEPKFLPLRQKDMLENFSARDALHSVGLEKLIDHNRYYRDAEGNTICIFSPYWIPTKAEEGPDGKLMIVPDLPERIGDWSVKVSPGGMMRAIVMRRADTIQTSEG